MDGVYFNSKLMSEICYMTMVEREYKLKQLVDDNLKRKEDAMQFCYICYGMNSIPNKGYCEYCTWKLEN
jgi:hypothetical protein